MPIHPMAGQPAPRDRLADVPSLVQAYYGRAPDPREVGQRVSFGTSGHRGRALQGSFNEMHVWAVTQAVCDYRRAHDIDGPLFLAMDSHALSQPAFQSALEVLVGNAVPTCIDAARGFTPTPAVSLAILEHNRTRTRGLADGIIITPSHNPPEDGGIKYNPPHGGPAETAVTSWIEQRANAMLQQGMRDVRRVPFQAAACDAAVRLYDYIERYARALAEVLDLEVIRAAGVRIGVDPLGGASLPYWDVIAERYRLSLEVVRRDVDPTFGFMPLDHDGKLRMDCSSRHAMADLIRLKDRYDVAFGNDPDADRHGIVTRSAGLLDPNHFLSVAIDYLLGARKGWPPAAAVGKTLVSSALIDRVASARGRPLAEVPVGFKWFVAGLLDGSCAVAAEESAGASFLRKDGSVWTTDKDGLLLGLLAAEITAVTGQDPGALYRQLVARLGEPSYERIDAPATAAQKSALQRLSPERVQADVLAGDRIIAKLTHASANQAPIGGLKVVTEHGWFAARPSGTEDIYKIYSESFRGPDHLQRIQDEARALLAAAFRGAADTDG